MQESSLICSEHVRSVGVALFAMLFAVGACGDDDPPVTPPTANTVTADADADVENEPEADVEEEPDAAEEVDVVVPCEDDDACDDGLYCDLESGDCLQGCRAGERVGTGSCEESCHSCDVDTRTCVENHTLPGCEPGCEGDSTCDDGTWCDPVTERCLVGCRLEAEECPDGDISHCCPSGSFCSEEHACVAYACAADDECDDLEFCFSEEGDGAAAECRSGCRLDDPETVGNEDDCATAWGNEADWVCDDELRFCERMLCDPHDDSCPEGYVCDLDRCRPGCRSDADCPETQPCDLTTRSCRCETDISCAGLDDLVCVDEHCVARCERNPDCELFDLPMCNPESGRCVDCECFDESLIDDDASEAPDSESLFFGVLCGADIDRYRVFGTAGETLNILVTPDRGDITVQLHDSPTWDALPLAEHRETIAGPGQFLQIAYPVVADGTYFISIFGAGVSDELGCSQVGYNTRVERYPTEECRPDEYEDDNSFAESSRLEDGPTRGLTLCAEDTDYWFFDTESDERVEITLFIAEEGENLDLVLYDEFRREVDRIDSGGRTELIFAGPTAEASTWYLAVIGHTSSDESGYELYRTDSRFGSCAVDELEPDNERDGATFAESGEEFDELTACRDDEDWFVTQGLVGGDLRVSFEQSSAACTVRLTLFSPSGSELQSVENSHPSKEIEVEGLLDSGSYAVQVRNVACLDGTDVEGVGYEIRFQFATPQCTDGFEDNDESHEATSILSGSSTFDSGDGSVLCVEDVDYYRFEVSGDSTLNATVNPVLFASSFGFDLLREDEFGDLELVKQCVRSSECVRTPSAVSIVDEPLTAGFYHLRVRQTGFIPVLGGSTYQLTVRLDLDDLECLDEGREPNDGFENTWAILPGSLCEADSEDDPYYFCERLCPEDNDTWWVGLGGQTHIEVDVSFEDGASGVVGLYELPPDGGEGDLELRDSRTGSGSVEADLLTGQAAIIVVESNLSTDELGDAYRFDVVMSSVEACLPSANASQDFPKSVILDEPTAGNICGVGESWYMLPVDSERVFSFALDSATSHELRLTLYQETDEGLHQIAQDTTSDGRTEIVRSQAWDGMAVLRVDPSPSLDPEVIPARGLPFTLTASSEAVSECGDSFEPNETDDDAVAVTGEVDAPLSICQDDNDWFTFEVADVDEDVIDMRDVTVSLHQLDTSAPLTLQVLDSEGATVAGPVTDSNADKILPMADLVEGAYSIHVFGGEAVPAAGLAYSLSVQVGSLDCSDALEDNDTIETASDFLGAESGFLNLTACEEDADVFEVVIGEGPASLDLSLSRPAPSVEIRLELLRDDGSEIDSETGSGVLIDLSATEMIAGSYYVRVTASEPPAVGENYALSIVLDEPFDCTDQYEGDGGNDTPDTATALGGATASISALACEDADVYRLDVPLGPVALRAGIIAIDPGPFTLTVLNSAEAELGDDPNDVLLDELAAGTYYLRVTTTDAPKRGRAYILSVATESDGCVLDPFEPNNSIDESLPLIPERSDSRAQALCPDDVDIYRVENTVEGHNLSVSVQHNPGANPLRVEVVDGSGDLVAENSFVEDSLGFMGFWTFNLAVGTYYVRVSATVGDDGLRYKLWHSLSEDSPCIDDGFEPNDSESEPFALSSGVNGAQLCPSQSDWYSQEVVSTDGELYVALTSESGTTFKLDLLADDGSTPLQGCSGSDVIGSSGSRACDASLGDTSDSGTSVTLFAPNLSAGTYLLHVSTDEAIDSQGVDYRLEIEREELGCINDASEPNASFEQASLPKYPDGSPVPFDGTRRGFQLCEDDSDFYILETTTGVLVTIQPALGNSTEFEACLYSSDETELNCVDILDRETLLAASNASEGEYTYYLRVRSEDAVGAFGFRYFLAVEQPPLCEDDAFEGGPDSLEAPIDGDVALARNVETNQPNTFRLCPGDQDIFEVHTSATRLVTCDPLGGDPDCVACEDDDPPPCAEGLGTKVVGENLDVVVETSIAQRWPRFRVELLGSDTGSLAETTDILNQPMTVGLAGYSAGTTYYVVASLDEEFGEPVDYTMLASEQFMCVTDSDNHTPEDAQTLTLEGSSACSNRCPFVPDYYEFTVSEGFVRLVALGGNLLGIKVEVTRDGETVPELAVVSSHGSQLILQGEVEAGTYQVVFTEGSASDLCVGLSVDDCLFDPSDSPPGANDTQPTAYNLDQVGGEFAICPTGSDGDWFAYELPDDRGGDWHLALDFQPSVIEPIPDFEIEIRESDGTLLTSLTDEDAEVVDGQIRTDWVNAGSDERTLLFHISAATGEPFSYVITPALDCPTCPE